MENTLLLNKNQGAIEPVHLPLVADAFGEGAGPLTGDVHKVGISRDLIEHGQDSLWFRQQAAVKVRLELQQGVVNSQPVVLHAPGNQVHVYLLTRQPFKNLKYLCRARIQTVVEV